MYLISGVLHSAHSEGESVSLNENKKRKRKVYVCFYVQWRRKFIAEKKESISQRQSHLGESKVNMTMGCVRSGARVKERGGNQMQQPRGQKIKAGQVTKMSVLHREKQHNPWARELG